MVRLGIFNYINIWPVYYRFLFGDVPPQISLVQGLPTELNEGLQKETIDVSCISSIQYAHLQNEIFLIPSLALASRGPVKSVFLVTKKPLEKFSGGKIFTTKASATSVVLLKILLDFFQVKGEFFPSSSPLNAFLENGDGCLIIGDEALRFGASFKKDAGLYLHDLGALWVQFTGKPFVWSLWGIRKESAKNASLLLKTLLESRDEGLSKLSCIAEAAAKKMGLTQDYMEHYFRGFRYTLAEEEKEGLLLFYEEAAKRNLSPDCSTLNFLESEELVCF
jgi:chorismate dehydratase